MKDYYAFLSGIHATLPLAELQAILEAERIEYRVKTVLDQLALFTANRGPAIVAKRAGFVHETGLLIDTCDQDAESLAKCFREIDWRKTLGNTTGFYVSLTRVKGVARNLDTREAAKTLGKIIADNTGLPVDRKGATVRVFLVEGVAVVGLLLAKQPKGFEERRPQRKPFFKPGALDPRLSRVFVNLARIPPGGLYLDPFCGTGGFAVEALSIGLRALCGDADRVMAEGGLRNLRFYEKIFHPLYEYYQADAAHTPLRGELVDGIGTDPPYGRSTTTKGMRVREILEGFLASAPEVVKKKGYIVYASPHWALGDILAENAGLYVAETHYMRVHGTLTRMIVVAQKP